MAILANLAEVELGGWKLCHKSTEWYGKPAKTFIVDSYHSEVQTSLVGHPILPFPLGLVSSSHRVN
jgi:hypothetical protein